jgi:hypothetical protein
VTDLEARIGRESHRMAVELLGADQSVPGVRETVQGLLDMARGLGLANLLTDDGPRRAGVVEQWARILDGVLRQRGALADATPVSAAASPREHTAPRPGGRGAD